MLSRSKMTPYKEVHGDAAAEVPGPHVAPDDPGQQHDAEAYAEWRVPQFCQPKYSLVE